MDNSTPQMDEQLVRYLDGELTGTDKTALENQLSADPALQKALESLQQARGAIRYFGLKEQVASIHASMMDELAPPVRKISSGRRGFRYSMAIAASLLLLVGAWMAYRFFSLTPDRVFTASYNTYELSQVRDGEGTAVTAVEKAYGEKNYTEVLRIHDAGEDHSPKGEFLCGVAAMELRDDAKAIKCFREVLAANQKSGEPVLNDESEYYLSLSYVRNKDFDFALPLLRKIKGDPEHKYHSKVTSGLIRNVKLLKWR